MPELLEAVEAVDAAEANGSCLHGGKRMRMKSESRCRKVIGFLGYHLVVASQHGGSELLEILFMCFSLHFPLAPLVHPSPG